MRFEFATSGRIVFGPGTATELPAIAAELGHRALVVTGAAGPGVASMLEALGTQLECVACDVTHEPDVDTVREGAALARREKCDLVVGIGGGSGIDTGKAVAALITNEGDPMDYLEVIGLGKPLTNPSVPFIAVPTTSGTGSEVTRNAVLGAPSHRVKVSMRSPHMLPRVALIDPELVHSLPPEATAYTGLDALTQLIEPFVSVRANPLVDGLCREGMVRAARSLRRAYDNGHDAAAREDMALASLFGGFALANAGLGAVHGFAGPLGGMIGAHHGALCATLLPGVTAANIRALRNRASAHPSIDRYAEVARIMSGRPDATADDAPEALRSLCNALRIPSVRQLGLDASQIPDAVAQAKKASSMKGNPIVLTDDELTAVLTEAMQS